MLAPPPAPGWRRKRARRMPAVAPAPIDRPGADSTPNGGVARTPAGHLAGASRPSTTPSRSRMSHSWRSLQPSRTCPPSRSRSFSLEPSPAVCLSHRLAPVPTCLETCEHPVNVSRCPLPALITMSCCVINARCKDFFKVGPRSTPRASSVFGRSATICSFSVEFAARRSLFLQRSSCERVCVPHRWSRHCFHSSSLCSSGTHNWAMTLQESAKCTAEVCRLQILSFEPHANVEHK